MQDLWWSLPASIEITACQGAPVITINDTIWIEHRDDFEHEILSE